MAEMTVPHGAFNPVVVIERIRKAADIHEASGDDYGARERHWVADRLDEWRKARTVSADGSRVQENIARVRAASEWVVEVCAQGNMNEDDQYHWWKYEFLPGLTEWVSAGRELTEKQDAKLQELERLMEEDR